MFSIIRNLLITAFIFSLAYLGFWQLQRAEIKQKNLKNFTILSQATPQFLPTILKNSFEKQPERFTPVIFNGTYLAQSWLLDNQMQNHQPGIRVLTPMQIPNLNKLVLIDRGWIAYPGKNRKIPDVPTPQTASPITGNIQQIPTGINLPLGNNQDLDCKQLQINLDYQRISRCMGQEVYPFVVQLTKDHPDVFSYVSSSFGTSVEKHLGYAAQWFCFAILSAVYLLKKSLNNN